jgi:hypothetical protein
MLNHGLLRSTIVDRCLVVTTAIEVNPSFMFMIQEMMQNE